ncbi:MAG: hypothetical protein A2428_15115 [Bdellovibrionales bacterium RIFOXYC1_FULL_54_43]|nr:MAG: hypothetical protein A2428_15115 [Bdellovibrionales bacterium RIFOXYC1_FULL_54_43]OFZ82275.1 MAG: hypothetical protein A2603_01150 [Bdellovibrionales bacterium RIFOXYD1_FULL_55_31]
MQRFELKNWEKALVAFSTVLFCLSATVYATNFPLWKYFYGYDTETEREKIGRLSTKQGTVRREILGEAEFKFIDLEAALYDQDTIVTGSGSVAHLELDEGNTIELGANAMVRLAFESQLSFGRIARTPRIDVVAGAVVGRAKKKPMIIRSGQKTIEIAKDATRVLEPLPPPIPSPVPRPLPSPSPSASPSPLPLPSPSASPSPLPLPSSSASPSPVPPAFSLRRLEVISPLPGASFGVKKWSPTQEVPVRFEWKVDPPDVSLLLAIRAAGRGKSLHEEVVPARRGKASFVWIARKPGNFEWELLTSKRERLTFGEKKAEFVIPPEFEGIQILSPLIAGESTASNLIKDRVLKKSLEITLRWQPLPGIREYRIEIAKTTGGKPDLVDETENPSFTLVREKIINSGRIFYRVSAELENGFIAVSETNPFIFDFLPPILTLPKDDARVAPAAEAPGGGNILLTWQHTNFTDSYELEIAKDENFDQIHEKITRKQNFLSLKRPPAGQYWWRVRSLSKNLSSAPSAAFRFTIEDEPGEMGGIGRGASQEPGGD